jgi:hypothetical protein
MGYFVVCLQNCIFLDTIIFEWSTESTELLIILKVGIWFRLAASFGPWKTKQKNTKFKFNIFVLGTALRSYNAFSTHTDRGRGRTIVRPTAKPREALVDTPGITGNPGDISEPSTPTVSFEKNMRSRNYFQST